MKARRHVALLVEDDMPMADAMRDLLDSLGYACEHASTKQQAETLVEQGKFCFVLLDLHIKSRTDSIEAHVEAGFTVLASIRERYPSVNERGHRAVQVIVVSGHGNEHQYIQKAMQLGASNFIKKPITEASDVGGVIEKALAASGRTDHTRCEAITRGAMRELTSTSTEISLVITGREKRQRIEVEVGGRALALTPATFLALLKLVEAKLDGNEGWVHMTELGAKNATDFTKTTRMKNELSGYVPDDHPIFENDRKQRYRLHSDFVIARVDFEQLAKHREANIRKLAAKIQRLWRS